MAFNFSDLQQKVSQSINNQWQILSKMKEWWIDPAKDVQYQIYDPDGNLQTIAIPNRAKIVNDVSTLIQKQMQKTVFVDQVNGDDNNDGSQVRPFRTLQKAIDSVPRGGFVDVYIQGNYTLNSDVIVENKKVLIRVQDGAILKPKWLVSSGYNWLYGFRCTGFVALEFYLHNTGEILLDDEGYSTNYQSSSFYQFIKKSESTIGYVKVSGGAIKLAGNSSIPAFMVHGHLHSSEALTLHLWNTSVVKSGLGSLTSGDGIFGLKANKVILKDGNGNNIAWTDVIDGIIRDTNGIPRNVISNIIL